MKSQTTPQQLKNLNNGGKSMFRDKQGFTLVEILIVVVILGILASIVVPKFSNAGDTATVSNLAAHLKTVRGQLELYKVDHGDQYPDLVSSWDSMVKKTDAGGNTAADASDPAKVVFGPYMKHAPKNYFQDSTTVAAACGDGIGWSYNQTSGKVTACVATAKAEALGLDAYPENYTVY